MCYNVYANGVGGCEARVGGWAPWEDGLIRVVGGDTGSFLESPFHVVSFEADNFPCYHAYSSSGTRGEIRKGSSINFTIPSSTCTYATPDISLL